MHALVSIIIPCYNAERWVAEAIQSCLDQTYRPIEVIVIDDGSTDKSLEVIKSFGDKIRWETGPNRGGCIARNRGLALANGDLIQFLDADDLLTQDCVWEKFNHPHESNVIVCSKVELTNDIPEGVITDFWNKPDYPLEYMLRHGSPQTAAPLHIRNQLLSIGGFRESLPCCQEYDLHLRLAILYGVRFVTISHVGVLIRPLNNSLSRSPRSKWTIAIINVLLNAAELLELNGKETSKNKAAIAQRLTSIARSQWKAGRVEEAKRLAKQTKSLSNEWFVGCYKGRLALLVASTIGFSTFESLHSIYIKFRRS